MTLVLVSCSTTPPVQVPLDRGVFASSERALYELNLHTGEATLQGFFDVGPVQDIALLKDTGELYGVTLNGLYRIDPGTAETVRVDVEGFVPVNSLTQTLSGDLLAARGRNVFRISLDRLVMQKVTTLQTQKSVSGDLIQHQGRMLVTLGAPEEDDTLAVIRPGGQVTELGSTGFRDVSGLTEVEGQLYGVTRLGEWISLDPVTGKGQWIHDVPFPGSGLQ
ncbi:hypothetical protein [Deinococcus cellulosilyticus]|nr:hypothetical protein [Deinococcus cellulosilyticus]